MVNVPLVAEVVENRRLTDPGWSQKVQHLALRLPAGSGSGSLEATGGSAVAYEPGDVAVVYPSNGYTQVLVPAKDAQGAAGTLGREQLTNSVELLAERLGLSLDAILEIDAGTDDTAASLLTAAPLASVPRVKPLSAPKTLPRRCSVRHLLQKCLDIEGVPRRSFFEQIAFFAFADKEQQDKLFEMARPDGADLYASYCTRERRTYVEVLLEFPAVNIPLAFLVELLPPLLPRYFSIASSPRYVPGHVEICYAVVEYRTKFGRRKTGVCSSWMSRLQPGDRVALHLKKGAFNVPLPSSAPLIMVGPGTGIAPMRSIVLDRAARILSSSTSVILPRSCHLFFGCRHKAKDWLYGKDFCALVAAGSSTVPSSSTIDGIVDQWLSEPGKDVFTLASSERASNAVFPLDTYHVAFSRDNPAKKVYVQGKIGRFALQVAEMLLLVNASIFISGSAKRMPCDVVDAFKDCLRAYIKDLQSKGVHQIPGAGLDVDAFDADKYMAAMERSRRLIIEAWS
jgi:sulfite reductase alpha subunit-like flavoprotein